MSSTSASRTRRIVSRITSTWAEIDHAQRRKFELQTGIATPSRRHDRKTSPQATERDTQF
jgi:hypothetical protein